jgi:DinB superfamily
MVMLATVRLLDEMDEQMWSLLQRNLGGLTEPEADWRPHPAANSVRWMVGHLAWFEAWSHDALIWLAIDSRFATYVARIAERTVRGKQISIRGDGVGPTAMSRRDQNDLPGPSRW